MDNNDWEALVLGGFDTLSPLPMELKKGVIATGILGLFSFISCGLLFIYISYRLLITHSNHNKPHREAKCEVDEVSRLSLGTSGKQSTDLRKTSTIESTPRRVHKSASKKKDSNSFLTLIHNLLVADMFQALAFAIGLTWWRENGIFVSSGLCHTQAFLIMAGSVSISVFLIAITINTFLTIVWGVKLSVFTVRSIVVFDWVFSFALAFAGLGLDLSTLSQQDQGGELFARSIGICWINHRYTATFGVWLQNFWLYLAIAVTTVCYAWILVSMLRNKQSPRHMPPSGRKNGPPELSGHHPAFLIYPAIYLATTIPLSLVGLLAAAGNVNISSQYFNLVASISSLAGLLDAILWSTTILLSPSKELEEVGLDAFDFVLTAPTQYGNIVWVEGPTNDQTGTKGTGRGRGRGRIWWRLQHGSDASRDTDRLPSINTDPIMEDWDLNGIHLDTITSVAVEHSFGEPSPPADSPTSKIPKTYHPTW